MYDEISSLIEQKNQKNIVKIHKAFKEKSELFLLLELMEGNLISQIWSNQDIFFILYDIVTVLAEIHSQNFVHLDIKPGNFN